MSERFRLNGVLIVTVTTEDLCKIVAAGLRRWLAYDKMLGDPVITVSDVRKLDDVFEIDFETRERKL